MAPARADEGHRPTQRLSRRGFPEFRLVRTTRRKLERAGRVPGWPHLDVAREFGVLRRGRVGAHAPRVDPGRLRAGQDQLQVSPRDPHLDPHGDAHPEHGARAAGLP